MSASSAILPREFDAASGPSGESRLQGLLVVFLVTGLFFMLLPGTLLGVWNLVSISNRHDLESLSPARLQAHGHAQIFGWIGTFILGIGFYSLSKMARLPKFAPARGWLCYVLWTAGVVLRWIAGFTAWEWHFTLPFSAALELTAFLIFFLTISGHRPNEGAAKSKFEPWIAVVASSMLGFLLVLILNVAATLQLAMSGAAAPALGHVLGQRLSVMAAWGFLVPAIWGFSARWLPTFLGLNQPRMKLLFAALGLVWVALTATWLGYSVAGAVLFPMAALCAVVGLEVFRRPVQPAKITGVHSSFPVFVRIAYVWLLIASGLWLYAALADRSGGIWGAARHALTVGFISTMVFSIGQRILPAFGGARMLHSPRLMFWSLGALSIGCALRVTAEIPAYEGYASVAWKVLPWSAVTELIAVTLFATNLILTFLDPPAHKRMLAEVQ